ncbi:MAG: class I SAM-dependent methyltransferase [Synergistaceae bacterium]|nr:class I SAM-dependent methyltransferase [Synergistaceae bacterium]
MFKKVLSYIASRWGGHYIDIGDTKAKIERIVSEQGSILDKYGFLENTDKSSVIAGNTRISMSHDYLRHYDFLFHSFRAEKFSLIEFGCAEGGSLRTWEKYFPSAQIYGVDLDENAKRHETERIHIVIGDATSTETFETLKASTGGNAFIILDDASHAWGDQRRSFELFWDLVSPGGFYVVEDLECGCLGAFPAYPPKVLDSQPFSEYMHDLSKILRWAPDRNPEENSYHFKHLPKNIQKIKREMDMCVFVPGAIIVRKKP